MKRAFALCLVLLLVVACEEDRVEVTILPHPDGTFTRTIRLYRVDDAKPGEILAPDRELLAAAAKHYGEPLATKDASVTFRGEFRELPPDVVRGKWTNRGGFTVWRSGAGSYGVYRERAPGPTDYLAREEAKLAAADTTVDVIRRMLAAELEGEEGLPELLAFVDGPFRRDMKDVLLLLDGPREEPRKSVWGGRAALALQLLVERGYLRVEEAPALFSSGRGGEMLARIVARRMGRRPGGSLGERFAFFRDRNALEAAFDRAIAAEGLTRKEFEEKTSPIGDAIVPLGSEGGTGKMTFRTEVPGVVLEESGTAELPLDGGLVRRIYYVEFTMPDREWQTRHLGGPVLDGPGLRDYALWLDGLSGEQREAWEAAMEKTAPGDELWPTIRAIRVTGIPEGDIEEGATILAEALGIDLESER